MPRDVTNICFHSLLLSPLWQTFIFSISGERLTTRLRVQLFKALVHQPVGWHDEEEHTTGSLTTMLYVDANNVKKVSYIPLWKTSSAFTLLNFETSRGRDSHSKMGVGGS